MLSFVKSSIRSVVCNSISTHSIEKRRDTPTLSGCSSCRRRRSRRRFSIGQFISSSSACYGLLDARATALPSLHIFRAAVLTMVISRHAPLDPDRLVGTKFLLGRRVRSMLFASASVDEGALMPGHVAPGCRRSVRRAASPPPSLRRVGLVRWLLPERICSSSRFPSRNGRAVPKRARVAITSVQQFPQTRSLRHAKRPQRKLSIGAAVVLGSCLA